MNIKTQRELKAEVDAIIERHGCSLNFRVHKNDDGSFEIAGVPNLNDPDWDAPGNEKRKYYYYVFKRGREGILDYANWDEQEKKPDWWDDEGPSVFDDIFTDEEIETAIEILGENK